MAPEPKPQDPNARTPAPRRNAPRGVDAWSLSDEALAQPAPIPARAGAPPADASPAPPAPSTGSGGSGARPAPAPEPTPELGALWARARAERTEKRWKRLLATLREIREITPEDRRVAPGIDEAEACIARGEKHLAGAEQALREGDLRLARTLAEAALVGVGESPPAERILADVKRLEGPLQETRARLDAAVAEGRAADVVRIAEELLEMVPQDKAARRTLEVALSDQAAASRRMASVIGLGMGLLLLALLGWLAFGR